MPHTSARRIRAAVEQLAPHHVHINPSSALHYPDDHRRSSDAQWSSYERLLEAVDPTECASGAARVGVFLSVGDLGRWGAIIGTFAATFVAGLGFIWLRHRSGHLIAPDFAHIATNSIPFAVAWFLAYAYDDRRRTTDGRWSRCERQLDAIDLTEPPEVSLS